MSMMASSLSINTKRLINVVAACTSVYVGQPVRRALMHVNERNAYA
jgi:hypothetical protein